MDPQERLQPADFAAKVKTKYPGVYDDVDDLELSRRIVSKYPDYAPHVSLPSFEDTYKDLNDTFTQKYGRGLEITGEDTPQHRQGGKVGRAKDIRTKDLDPEQLDFLRTESGKRGFKMFDYSDLSGAKTLRSGMTITGPHLHIEYPEGVGTDTTAGAVTPVRSQGVNIVGNKPVTVRPQMATGGEFKIPSIGFQQTPAQEIAQKVASERAFVPKYKPVTGMNLQDLTVTGSAAQPQAPPVLSASKATRMARQSSENSRRLAAEQKTRKDQADYLRSLPPEDRRAAAVEIARREPLTDESKKLAGFGVGEQIFQATAGPVLGVIGETVKGVGQKAEQVAPYLGYEDYHSPLSKVGGDVLAASEHLQRMAPQTPAAKFAGGVASAIPYAILPKGLAPFAIQSYLAEIGRGADEETAIKHAVTSVAGLAIGGQIGKGLEESVRGTVKQYLARSAGAASGLEAMSALGGEPQRLEDVAKRGALGLVFGVHGGKREARPLSGVQPAAPEAMPITEAVREVAPAARSTIDSRLSETIPPTPEERAEQLRLAEEGKQFVERSNAERRQTSGQGPGGIERRIAPETAQAWREMNPTQPRDEFSGQTQQAKTAREEVEQAPRTTSQEVAQETKAEINIGDRVWTPSSGKGEVVNIADDGYVTVRDEKGAERDYHPSLLAPIERTKSRSTPETKITEIPLSARVERAKQTDKLEDRTETEIPLTGSRSSAGATGAVPVEEREGVPGTRSLPAPSSPATEPDQHHSAYQPRDDEGHFAGEPEYPKGDPRGAEARRLAAYDKLVELRQGAEDALYQASNLTAEETDRVRAKFEALKKEGRPIKAAVEDYLRQGGLFGHELNPDQQELLRDLASPARRSPVKAEQGALFETTPTVESRREQSQIDRAGPTIKGGLFQDDQSDAHSFISEVVDSLAEQGVTTFKEAVGRFRDEFGPASEYGDIFEEVWDANKKVKKRGRLTFDDAFEELPSQGSKSGVDSEVLDLVQYIRGRGGINMGETLKGEKAQLRESRLSQPGVFTKKGLAWDDMETELRADGYLQEGESLLDALDAAARGEKRYANSAAYGDQIENEFERHRREEFAKSSDHSIMARAFDNPDDPIYKEWLEAYARLRNKPEPEDFTVFAETSREIGISTRSINRLIQRFNRLAVDEAERDERLRRDAQRGSSLPKDADSLRQSLVDQFGYSNEAAEATTSIADALVETLSKESGQSRESLYDQIILARGPGGKGLEQKEGESQRIGIFNKEGKLVGTASLSEKSDPAKWVEQNYGKGFDFGPLKMDDPKLLNQSAHGVTEFLRTGEVVIRALKNPNESTAVHEIHHALLPTFMRISTGDVSEQFARDMKHMSRWMGFQDAAHFNELHDQYVNGTLKGRDLRIYIDGQEKGARGFERYLRTGKAPTVALESAFAKFKEWLTNIYRNLTGSPIDVGFSQQQVAIWDRMLGGKGESGPKVTGIKNATVNAERADRGLDPIEHELRRGFGQVLDEGKDLVDNNPQFRDAFVQGLIDNPRAPTDAEDAALAYDRMKLHNEHRQALREMGEAVRRDDGSGVFDAERKLQAIEAAIDLNDQASRISGTESGRSLNARKMMIREDYSLATMIQKATVAARESGKKLTPEVREQIEKMAERIADYESKLDAREKYITELESQRARDEKVSNWRAVGRKAPRRPKEALDNEFTKMESEFARLAGVHPSSPAGERPAAGLFQASKMSDYDGPFTPEMEKLIKDMARNRVEAGARTAEEVNAEVHAVIRQYLPDVEPREVGDVWSGYGKQARLSRDEIDVALREAKRQQRLLSALEDAQAGESPRRTGLQRDKASDRVRELTKAVNAEMRRQGMIMQRSPAERWATALEGIKTRLRNSIEDMNRRLETGEKPAKRASTPLDAEARELKAQRDALARTLRDIEGPRKLTDEERIQMSERAIEKSIADLDKRIGTREISPRSRTSAPWSPKIGELQAQRKALSDTLKAMRDAAKPPRDKDAAALKAFKTRVEKSAAEYQRRLDQGDFTTTAKRKPLELDPEAKELAAKRDLVKKQYQNQLEAMRPGKWYRNISGLRKSWMLSGLSTQARNIGGTGVYQIFDEIARMPAAIADAVVAPITGQRSIQGPSPVAALDSVIAAVKVGGKEAKEIMKHGATVEQMKQLQFGQEVDTGIKAIDMASNAIFRFMSASDRVFYNHALKRNLIDRTTVQAKNEARTDKALNVKQRAKDLVENPSPDLKASAIHDALVNTFNNNNSLSDGVKRARSKFSPGVNFAIDLVMPFDRTPTNVIARILEASPYGFARNVKQIASAVINREMTVEQQRDFSKTFGRATVGTSLMALGWYLGSRGVLTGAPSPDQAERKDQMGEGVEFNSIRIGDKWIDVGSISPVGNLLTIGAGLYHESHRDKGTGWDVWGAAAKPLLDQPLLRGVSQISDLVTDPERTGAKATARFASSFVPFSGAVRDVAKVTDKAKRRYAEPTSIKEQVQQNIPVLREKLPEKRPSKGGMSYSSGARSAYK